MDEQPARKRRRGKQLPNGVAGPMSNAIVDVGKAMELRFKGLTYQQIADLQGVGLSTVQARLARFTKLLQDPQAVNSYTDNQIAFLQALDMQLGLAMADKVNDRKSSVNNLAFAKSKIFEQLRLLRGESTSNIHNLTRVILEAHQGKEEADSQLTSDNEHYEALPLVNQELDKSSK